MSVKNFYEWVCDLCGAQDKTQSPDVPAGWSWVAYEKQSHTDKHFCSRCCDEIESRRRPK